MRGIRSLIAFACLAVFALAPPAMASPTDFGNATAYASPIDQDNADSLPALAALATVQEADARTSGALPASYSTTSPAAVAGHSIRLDAPYARLDPGRGFG